MRTLGAGLVVLGTMVAATGCGGADESSSTVDVAVAFFPLGELARNVAGSTLGNDVTVASIVPEGEQAHDYEPTPRQLDDLAGADVVLYLGNGFQAGTEKAIDSLPDRVVRIDLLDSVDLIEVGTEIGTDEHADEHAGPDSLDPHVWLSPRRMAIMAATVADAIAEALEAAGAADAVAGVRAGEASYTDALSRLDADFAEGLRTCEHDIVVTGHHAFGYLAADYGLTQVAISGISPSEEPSAVTLEEIAEFASDNGISTIFFEENLPADLSRTVADEIGATTARLDPVEAPSSEQLDAGATYVSLMGENLESLRTGLGCW